MAVKESATTRRVLQLKFHQNVLVAETPLQTLLGERYNAPQSAGEKRVWAKSHSHLLANLKFHSYVNQLLQMSKVRK